MSAHPTATSLEAARPASPVRRLARTLRDFALWRHERGSWQYDVMVVLILLFVLLTPARWFHDQPLPPAFPTDEIVVVRKVPPATHYRIRAHLLWQYGSEPDAAARALLRTRHSKPFTITSIQPVEDDAGAVVWYDVAVRDARE